MIIFIYFEWRFDLKERAVNRQSTRWQRFNSETHSEGSKKKRGAEGVRLDKEKQWFASQQEIGLAREKLTGFLHPVTELSAAAQDFHRSSHHNPDLNLSVTSNLQRLTINVDQAIYQDLEKKKNRREILSQVVLPQVRSDHPSCIRSPIRKCTYSTL